MAYHQIQCPHCFTDYTISDEQYYETEGMVRCGTCREQFKAIVVTEGGAPPKFDPRDVFIEPLSSPLAASEGGDKKLSGEPDESYVSYKKSTEEDEDTFVEFMSSHEFEYTGPKQPEVPSDVAQAYGTSDELSTSEILRNLRQRQADVLSKEDPDVQGQLDLELPSNADSDRGQLEADDLNKSDNGQLIDEVDKLVDKKLLSAPAAISAVGDSALFSSTQNRLNKNASEHGALNKNSINKSVLDSDDHDLFLQTRRKSRRNRGWLKTLFSGLFWGVIAIILIAGLVYQLWLKQMIDLPTEQAWVQQSMSYLSPHFQRAEARLAEYDIVIPQRRNLSKLELVSAKTEPHPDRATTVLLKVSLVNHAAISQPLPWLEVSLTDTDGRLVARRNLSPLDYIYNNRTSAQIGPSELKKVTIELLSFPKDAAGFEIKLLDK